MHQFPLYQTVALLQSAPVALAPEAFGRGVMVIRRRGWSMMLRMRGAVATLFVLALATGLAPIGLARAGGDAATSGLPVPRFVSLKSDRVNVRGGPDKDHDVAWIYTRVGWPVEITAEFENWRRIRDFDGTEGWVYHSMLSGKRTASVQLKSKTDATPLYAKPDAQSTIEARLQSGVIGAIKRCNGTWCRLVGEGFDGWIEQNRLWGVYPDEKIE